MLRGWILALSPKTASSSGWVGAGIAAPYRTRRALLVSLAARHMRAPRRTPPGNRSSPPTAALRQVRPRPVPEQQSSDVAALAVTLLSEVTIDSPAECA